MKQRWAYRFYPTPEQEKILASTFGCVRYVYNWGLAARIDAMGKGTPMSYAASDRALTKLKAHPDTIWLNEVSSVPMQQALRDLQSAFARYASGLAKHPAFKRKGERAAARYTKAGFRLINHRDLYIAKLGKLRLRWDRNLPAYPSSLTLIREATGRYLVSFVVDVMQVTLPRTFRSVGIDFGLSRLATLSTGDYFSNPRHLRKYAGRLAMLQRRTRRKQKRSQRLLKARQAIARCHAKVANARKDTLNKLTTLMVRRYDTICIEDLNLRGMVKNQVLARSLHDAGIGMAIRMLEEKAERYGKCVVRVDRFFPSSKTCSECGFVAKSMPLSIRQWQCAHCGTSHDRDENAARNILAAGQAVAAHGDRVRTA